MHNFYNMLLSYFLEIQQIFTLTPHTLAQLSYDESTTHLWESCLELRMHSVAMEHSRTHYSTWMIIKYKYIYTHAIIPQFFTLVTITSTLLVRKCQRVRKPHQGPLHDTSKIPNKLTGKQVFKGKFVEIR